MERPVLHDYLDHVFVTHELKKAVPILAVEASRHQVIGVLAMVGHMLEIKLWIIQQGANESSRLMAPLLVYLVQPLEHETAHHRSGDVEAEVMGPISLDWRDKVIAGRDPILLSLLQMASFPSIVSAELR